MWVRAVDAFATTYGMILKSYSTVIDGQYRESTMLLFKSDIDKVDITGKEAENMPAALLLELVFAHTVSSALLLWTRAHSICHCFFSF